MDQEPPPVVVYQMHVWLRETSPLIWRWLFVRADSSFVPRGPHLLLQVRIAVLNEDLRATCCRWYPGLAPAEPPTERRAG